MQQQEQLHPGDEGAETGRGNKCDVKMDASLSSSWQQKNVGSSHEDHSLPWLWRRELPLDYIVLELSGMDSCLYKCCTVSTKTSPQPMSS